MASKIDELTSSFSDFLRPNLYAVYIFPKSITTGTGKNVIGMLCHEAVFPFHTFTTNSYWYNNKETSFINKIDYDPATFTFYVDRDNVLFDFFNKWNKNIYNEDHQFGFYDDYISTIEIEIFDRRMQTSAIATLVDAYPINFQSLDLGYSQNDAVMTFQVSFQFKEVLYNFFKAPKQDPREILPKISSWKDLLTLGNVRRGVNMVSKLKNYRRTIENGNVYDIARIAKKAYNKINTSPGKSIGGVTNIVKKASKLFK